MSNEIFVGDIGTLFNLTLISDASVLDISTATSITIRFKKPSNVILDKSAVLLTDGKDGIVSYTSTAGDLTESGTWALQLKLVMPIGTWSSQEANFNVKDTL